MDSQLQLCDHLYQAVVTCQHGCHTPANFNSILLQALQELLQELRHLKEDEHTRAAKQCLGASLQLLSRVSCLGPIEAFFTADDLLLHYQRCLEAIQLLTSKLRQQQLQESKSTIPLATQSAAEPVDSCGTNSSVGSYQLQLPQQQLRVVTSFRQQATQLFPHSVVFSSSEQQQQLCDTVKKGLILVKGHSFLIDQEWQTEVSAMLGRAEQLKILLSHRQAHHISLLAAVLQLLHHAEVQEFDHPAPQLQSHATVQPSVSCRPQPHSLATDRTETPTAAASLTAKAGGGGGVVSVEQGQQQARVIVAAGVEFTRVLDHPDEFYIPVAPLSLLTESACSTPRCTTALAGSALPFSLADPGSTSMDMSDDSLARMPSSGCSSLLEYMHSMPYGTGGSCSSADCSVTGTILGSAVHSTAHSSTGQQQVLRRITEEQLQGIAGPEVASILAAALGAKCMEDKVHGHDDSDGLPSLRRSSSSHDWVNSVYACGSKCEQPSDFSNPTIDLFSTHSAEPLMSGLPTCTRSSYSPKQERQRRSRMCTSTAVQTGSTSGARHSWKGSGKQCKQCELRLQHTPLPPGCCKSIGAVLYIGMHLTQVVMTDVGLNDPAVFDLVDALRVNSSVVLLDLSHNRIEDLGARGLAGLLKPRSGNSSRLRALYLQGNRIGDDGAQALATGLSHNTSLRIIWLQQNAIGAAGGLALATVMQHNTSCMGLKLLPQTTDSMPKQLGQMAEKLARHNKGVRDHIKGILTRGFIRQVDN